MSTPIINNQFQQYYASPAVLAEMERQDLDKLSNIVKEAMSSICSKTGLEQSEVLSIFGKARVERVDQLKGALDALETSGEMVRTDTAMLAREMEHAIAVIAEATQLDTDEISDVFSRERGSSLEIVIKRLRSRSKRDRADQQ